MTTFSALGAASGLPLNEMVTQLVKLEKDVKLGRIDSRKRQLDASLSAFGKLQSSLSKFQDALKNLTTNNLNARTVSITQPTENRTYIEASASSTASAGSFDIKVNQLASGSRFESADMAFGSANDVIATSDGTLTFNAGSASFDIEVTAGMTLEQLRKKINEASDNFGVSANIINAGGDVGTKLVFTSNVTGDGNDLSITSNNAELDVISTQAFSGGAGGLTAVQAAQNAIIEVDGITATNATNTFSNVVQDLTITVQAVTPEGSSATLNVGTDKEAVRENIKAFIESYNALVTEIESLTKPREVSEDGRNVTSGGGTLNGDSLVRSLSTQMRSILGASPADADDTLNTLYAMGITFDATGRLEIATSTSFGGSTGQERFDAALDTNFDGIARLFSGENGIATQLNKFVEDFNGSDGLIKEREKSLKGQLDRNSKDREAANRYLESFEQTLRKRYVALDGLLGQLNNTASMVMGQLANLPSFGSQSKR